VVSDTVWSGTDVSFLHRKSTGREAAPEGGGVRHYNVRHLSLSDYVHGPSRTQCTHARHHH